MPTKLLNGKPPEGHPRQCRVIVKKTGKRCHRWALRGIDRCQWHGGRQAQRGVRIHHLPRFYSKILGPTLSTAVEELLGVSPAEQTAVFEELALMRVAASESIKLYAAACSSEKSETRIAAAGLMQDALKEVVAIAESAARIEAAGKDKLSIHGLQHVVNQLIRLMYDACGDDHSDIAERFEESIRQSLRVPGEPGTDLKPWEDVSEMDDTIPKGE